MKALEIASMAWVLVSFVFVATTWLQIRAIVRLHGTGLHPWDQLENFGRFRRLALEEKIPDVRARYTSLLRNYIWATASTITAFVVFAWTRIS